MLGNSNILHALDKISKADIYCKASGVQVKVSCIMILMSRKYTIKHMISYRLKLKEVDVILDFNNSRDIKILTVQEVADLLRVHRATISRLATSGELKSHLIGNRRLFKEEDVLMFFDNQVDRRYVFEKEP